MITNLYVLKSSIALGLDTRAETINAYTRSENLPGPAIEFIEKSRLDFWKDEIREATCLDCLKSQLDGYTICGDCAAN